MDIWLFALDELSVFSIKPLKPSLLLLCMISNLEVVIRKHERVQRERMLGNHSHPR